MLRDVSGNVCVDDVRTVLRLVDWLVLVVVPGNLVVAVVVVVPVVVVLEVTVVVS